MPMPVRHPLEPDRTAFVRSPALATRCGEKEQHRACAMIRSSVTKNDDTHISSYDVTNGRCISKFGSQRRDVTAACNDAAKTRSLVMTSRFDIARGERVYVSREAKSGVINLLNLMTSLSEGCVGRIRSRSCNMTPSYWPFYKILYTL